MTVKVYVNNNNEIISENQYKKLIDKKYYELGRDTLCNLFDEWFKSFYDGEYKVYDLLVFNAETRGHVLAKFKAWATIAIVEKLEKEWFEREIEL